MMGRPLEFPMLALSVALMAKTSRAGLRDQIDLTVAALSPDVSDEAREAVCEFVQACREERQPEAGELLHAWIRATYKPRPAPAPEPFAWQTRKDIMS